MSYYMSFPADDMHQPLCTVMCVLVFVPAPVVVASGAVESTVVLWVK